MKIKSSIILLILPLFIFGQTRSELNQIPNQYLTNDEFELKNGDGNLLLYKKNSNKPYTGKVTIYFDFGEIKIDGNCIDGVKTGIWKIFKETSRDKKIKEKIFEKRNDEEKKQIADIRQCIVGYNWRWENPDLGRDYLQYRFYSNGNFVKSVINAYPPIEKRGTWTIDKLDNNRFKIRGNRINFEIKLKSSGWDNELPLDRTPYIISCSKFAIYNGDWYKDGDDSNEWFNYYKSDPWSENSKETLEESLKNSEYSDEFTWQEEIKTIKETSPIHLLEYNTNGEIITIFDSRWDKGYKDIIQFDQYGILHKVKLRGRFLNLKEIYSKNIEGREIKINSDEETLYHTYEEYYKNGNIKKKLTFKKDKDNTLYSEEESIKYINSILDDGFQLFENKQYIYHENGELQYTVTFDKKSIKSIKIKDKNDKQNYYINNEKYYIYIGKGYEYDKNGKKIGKIYWDQHGRICDKNGNIINDKIENVNINSIIFKEIKGTPRIKEIFTIF